MLIFQNGKVGIPNEFAKELKLFKGSELGGYESQTDYYLGDIGSESFFVRHLPNASTFNIKISFAALREFGAQLDKKQIGLAVQAQGLANWHEKHPRCSICGGPTLVTSAGAIRKCPQDDSEHYPRTDSAIIVLVKDKSDVYLGGMSIGDYGVKLIIGGVANKLTTLNLANNKIRDEGAKLLADSLSNGEMPNLKKLHLEGNKITDKGEDALVNVLKNENVKNIIITTMTIFEKYQLNINGSADRKMSIFENRLEQAKARGIDVDNVVVERTTLDWIKNKVEFFTKLSFGWVKCMVTYDDVPSFAGERLLAKLSSRTSLANDAKDSLLCYFEAENDALQTEEGVKHTKYQMLDVITSPELTGNIEAWYDTLYH